jgi:hypothetical protein
MSVPLKYGTTALKECRYISSSRIFSFCIRILIILENNDLRMYWKAKFSLAD